MYIFVVCAKNDAISYPKNISAVKKDEAKKVQVTERPKGVKSLWGQEERYTGKAPAYKAS